MSGVREAIEAGDVDALEALVAASPDLAEADVRCGPAQRHRVPALHHVCDAVFRGLVTQEQALALAQVLLAAGVDPNRAYARSGDTYLIAAASLGAEGVGLALLERGAHHEVRGLFGATALHWCGFMGLAQLTGALLDRGADLELRDRQHDCTPLEWALHAWREGTNGRRDQVPAVARLLVEHGARVPADALDGLDAEADEELRAALRARSRSAGGD